MFYRLLYKISRRRTSLYNFNQYKLYKCLINQYKFNDNKTLLNNKSYKHVKYFNDKISYNKKLRLKNIRFNNYNKRNKSFIINNTCYNIYSYY